MPAYDYEGYFSKEKKLSYWKGKRHLDEKYLAPMVDKAARTLNAGSGLFVERPVLGLKNVVCADISRTAVKKLQSEGVRAVRANLLEKWPFRSGEFQQVLLLDILEHLGHVEFFLGELNRVTAMGGAVILGIPLLDYWRSRLRLLLGTTSSVQYDEHPRMFFDSDVKRLFAGAGFTLSESKYIGLTRGYGYYKFTKK